MVRWLAAYRQFAAMIFGTPDSQAQGRALSLWPFLFLFVGLAVLFTWAAPYCLTNNADDLLPGISSVQKITLFYWGQNRLANLLPALTFWIENIEVNYAVQVFLRTLTAFAIPWFVLQQLRPVRAPLLGYCLGVIAIFLLLSQEAIDELFTAAQPYGTSILLAGLASFCVRDNDHSTRQMLVLGALQTLLLTAALLVNLSLFVLLATYGGLGLLCQPTRVRLFGLLPLILAMALSLGLASTRGSASDYVALLPSFEQIAIAWHSIASQLSLPVLWALLAIVGFAQWALQHQKSRNRAGPQSEQTLEGIIDPLFARTAFLFIACLALLTAAAFSPHVRLNLTAARYFTLSFALIAAMAGVLLGDRIAYWWQSRGSVSKPPIFDARNIHIKVLAFLACSAIFTTTVLIKADRLFACSRMEISNHEPIEALAAVAERYDASFIAGDYWTVWPAVYATLALRSDQDDASPVYGLTYRGREMLEEITQWLSAAQEANLLCVGTQPPACYLDIKWIDPAFWPANAQVIEQASLPDGQVYWVVRLSP